MAGELTPRGRTSSTAWQQDAAAPTADAAAEEQAPQAPAANGHATALENCTNPGMQVWEANSTAWSLESAAKAHLRRHYASRPSRNPEQGSNGSPSRLPKTATAESDPGAAPAAACKASGHIVLPDLSFMLSDRLMLPSKAPRSQ